MNPIWRATGLMVFGVLMAFTGVAWGQWDIPSIRNAIRTQIEGEGHPSQMTVCDNQIHCLVVLPLFYEQRDYRPAWIGEDGISPNALALVKAIEGASQEGLASSDYHLEDIRKMVSGDFFSNSPGGFVEPGELAEMDIFLTDAFLLYGSHLLAGLVDPIKLDPLWQAERRKADLVKILEDALAGNQVEAALQSLLPPHVEYQKLRQALGRYQEMARKGGWGRIPEGTRLKAGDRGKEVLLLRERLTAEGMLLPDQEKADMELFDPALKQALLNYQAEHGLEPDGVPGKRTIACLNTPVEARVRQIAVNMERCRWLSHDLGARHVRVNIAGFRLDVMENGRSVMHMRVIAGKPFHNTPVFSDRITYLVMNPSWEVPPSIARTKILPKARKDKNFLRSQGFRVSSGWGDKRESIDPDSVDWKQITPSTLRYRFTQDPGPLNSLGRVKFMFPNQFQVYLHDTPEKDLFAKAIRDFSSGCVRVEKPVDLAEYLLKNHPQWPQDRALSVLTGEERETYTVIIPDPIPIHILYCTVWVDDSGLVHFGPDIYQGDILLDRALNEPARAS